MWYLTNHTTEEEYNTVKHSLPTPQVALTMDDYNVHYQPYDPYGGHDYVEIGGLKWATMNIGATAVTDTGLYFQWGDTQGYTAAQVGSGSGKKAFIWNDYKFWTADDGSGSSGFTKYNSTDGKNVLGIEDDGVNAAWGRNWRMPTAAEFQALGNAVNTQWVTNYQGSGVNGRLMTDKTDSSKVLFFPAVGSCYNGKVNFVRSGGYYWSSSFRNDNVIYAYNLYSISSSIGFSAFSTREYGLSLRGVAD